MTFSIFGTVILVAVATHVKARPHVNNAYVLSAAVTAGVGSVLQGRDQERVDCDPDSAFQGHAAFHLLTAWSLHAVFMYVATERQRDADKPAVQFDESDQGLNINATRV